MTKEVVSVTVLYLRRDRRSWWIRTREINRSTTSYVVVTHRGNVEVGDDAVTSQPVLITQLFDAAIFRHFRLSYVVRNNCDVVCVEDIHWNRVKDPR